MQSDWMIRRLVRQEDRRLPVYKVIVLVALSPRAISMISVKASVLGFKTAHLGYPIFSGRIIQVIQNSGNENCYAILVLKQHYLPIILGIR